jgi:DNA polymerase delta subunit 2
MLFRNRADWNHLFMPLTFQRYIIPSQPREKYISAEDEYMLEDEYGRLKLVGNILKKEIIVTGIIMAVLGIEIVGGEFEVQDYCFAEPPLSKPLPTLKGVDAIKRLYPE